jgi:hypothetical protein
MLRSDTVPADFIDGTLSHIHQNSDRLWQAVPLALRRLRLSLGDTPEWETRFSHGAKVRTMWDLHELPEPLAREILYATWRLIELGAAVQVGDMSVFVRELRRVTAGHAPARQSLMDAPVAAWEQDLLRAGATRRGKVPDRWDRQPIRSQLHRIYFAVYSAYDTRPWWRREIWDAEMDRRIPLREHEPRTHASHFTDIHPQWLRDGLQYFLGMQMQTGALSMSSARSYLISIRNFGRHLQARGVEHPRLADTREELRDLVMGWRGEVASTRSERTGGPLSPSTAYQYLNHPEILYGWLLDHRTELARAVDDDRWLALGIEHSRFYRPGERPRTSAKAPSEDENHRGCGDEPRARGRRRARSQGSRRRRGRSTGRTYAAVAGQDRAQGHGDPSARLRPPVAARRRSQRRRRRTAPPTDCSVKTANWAAVRPERHVQSHARLTSSRPFSRQTS